MFAVHSHTSTHAVCSNFFSPFHVIEGEICEIQFNMNIFLIQSGMNLVETMKS